MSQLNSSCWIKPSSSHSYKCHVCGVDCSHFHKEPMASCAHRNHCCILVLHELVRSCSVTTWKLFLALQLGCILQNHTAAWGRDASSSTPGTASSNESAAYSPWPPHSAPGSLTCGDSLRCQHVGSISHLAGLLLPLGVGVNGCRELGTQRNHLPRRDLLLLWLCQMEWRKQGRRRALAALVGGPGPPGAEEALRHSCL